MENLLETIEKIALIPVVVINDAEKAVDLAKALIDGGIPCAEVTFRTDAAEEAIKRINKAYPQMLLGAGTVVTTEQAKRAVNAGARFLVSPGYDQNLVDWCKENKIPYFPGVCTASEVQVAVANGFNVLKFFPAEASGGVGMIKNLCGPFPQVRFMTTGGISLANIADYAACPNVIGIGGSWMVKADLIQNSEWSTITKLCKEAVLAVQGFEFAHIGINSENIDEASKTVSAFEAFNMVKKVGNSSTFMNSEIEVLHSCGRGRLGHIGFKTWNVERAVSYLAAKGFTVAEDSVSRDAKGKIKVCYLNEEIGGFAIHLIKK